MWRHEYERFSLGKVRHICTGGKLEVNTTCAQLSALRELTLAKEMHDAGAPGMQYLYMGEYHRRNSANKHTQPSTGFYIHSCQKMRYKGEYSPSYLADPEEYTWHPIEECRPLLDQYRYASFAHPEHSVEGDYVGPGEHNSGVYSSTLLTVAQITTRSYQSLPYRISWSGFRCRAGR